MLSDTRSGGLKPDATTRTSAEAVRIMNVVAAKFMWQANVNLTQVGSPTPVVVPSDLGDPFNVDDVGRVLTPIRDATQKIAPNLMASGIVRVFCCWDVTEDKIHDAIGETRGMDCFVEDGTEETTFAHEVGHALGLRSHNFAATAARPLLMDESLGKKTFKLQQIEIDQLNPSGKFGT